MTDKEVGLTEELPNAQTAVRDVDEIDLIDLLIVLVKHKALVVGLPFAAVVVAAVITLTMPNIYTATARILPPQQNQSVAANILGQIGGLSALAPTSIGAKSPGDLYVGMLKSRSVADSLIERFNLPELFDTRTLDDTRMALAGITTIATGRDGIISISVDHKDPARAARLANAYVEELERMHERLAVTEAAQRRLFFEKQLQQQKNALASAEVELKKTQEQTGLIKLDEQGRAIIEAVASLRAQIAAKEVQIGAMRSFTTDHNPERVRAEAELNGLRQELGKLEQNKAVLRGSTFVPTGKVPEVGLEYVRKLRDVKYHETLFDLLARQYEVARLDESKDASLVQVLDSAVPPQRKSKPVRTRIVVITALAVGILAVVLAFVRESFLRAQSDPERKRRIALLVSHLGIVSRHKRS